MAGIVTVTFNPAIDISCSVDLLEPRAKLRTRDAHRGPGGGGVNVSRALKKLGTDSISIHLSGGPTGDLLEYLLGSEGVEGRRVQAHGLTREDIQVHEESTGHQYRFVMEGPEARPAEIRACAYLVEELRPEWLVLSGSLPPGAPASVYADMARKAGEDGTRVVVDAKGESLERALEAGVFLAKPNRREFAQLAGMSVKDASWEDIAGEIHSRYQVEYLVVSLGSDGAIMTGRGLEVKVTAPEVRVQSMSGAGDSMVAGLVLGFSRGLNPEDALRLGVAAGTSAATTPGSELCDLEETKRLLERLEAAVRCS